MGIVRNHIDIIGITSEDELPNEINGQVIEYSETESIFIDHNKPSIKKILKINLEIQINSRRKVNSPLGKILVLDGTKKCTIVYAERGYSLKTNIINLDLPYNTFIELPKGVEDINSVKVYILDAYFHLLESRKLYSHIVYLVNVDYDNKAEDFAEYEDTNEQNTLEINMTSSKNNITNKAEEEMLLSKDITNIEIKMEPTIKNLHKEKELIDIDEEYL